VSAPGGAPPAATRVDADPLAEAGDTAEGNLARLRRNIDAVDEVLVKLFNQRAKWALEIGRVKKRAGLPIYQPHREAEVVAHVLGANRGPLDHSAVKRLFERVIDENRQLERIAEPGDAPAAADEVREP
jgi:chorismate mutase